METTDQEIRRELLQDLASKARNHRVRAAISMAIVAQRSGPERDIELRHAQHLERRAAHYQQAIDLLTAAPMPPKDGPR